MDELELKQLRKNAHWVAVLERYHQQSDSMKSQSKDFDGWVPRLHDVTDVPAEDLPGIHGKLIAFGFLKFDLAGRDAGIRYQLTTLGRQGINSSDAAEPSDSADDACEAA